MKVIQSVDNIAGYIPMWVLNLPTSGSSLKVIHRSSRYRRRLFAKRMDDACSKTDPKWGGTNKRSALCTLTTKIGMPAKLEWSMSPHVWIHQPAYTHVMYIYMMFMLTKSSGVSQVQAFDLSSRGMWLVETGGLFHSTTVVVPNGPKSNGIIIPNLLVFPTKSWSFQIWTPDGFLQQRAATCIPSSGKF